jgi:hypothetical protein
MLEGKKTYIIAILMALGSIASAFGFDIPGFPADPHWGTSLLAALGLGTLRMGVAKSNNGG